MPDNGDALLPTPHEGWEVTANAFDQDRDPNQADGPATYEEGHGRLLVKLDVTVDKDGRVEGLVQFVHRDFATEIGDPELADLIADVTDTVYEIQKERTYLEVEYYEDGLTNYARLFDAAGLDEFHRRLAADPEDDIDLDDFLAQFPDDEDDDADS